MELDEYEKLRELSEKIGYSSFTKLQETAFSHPEILSAKWKFVIGDTSSGKTLIPLLPYFLDYIHSESKCCPTPKMLFAVPYRALAAQKSRELSNIAKKLNLNVSVVQCTGEFRQDDMNILNAGVNEDNAEKRIDIVVIIYEKSYLFANLDEAFLERYQYLVLDEFGLTQDIERGIKADLLLCKAASHRDKLRVFALGTPFYDWGAYICSYGFELIKVEKRPIELKTYPIFAIKGEILHTEDDCPVSEGKYEPEPATDWTFPIVEKICSHHLKKNHRILVFLNNRERVKELSRYLMRKLKALGLLTQWINPLQCREDICNALQVAELDCENVLYSIMDDLDFEAISYGIGFHNADLFYPIRTYIEQEILEPKGNLRIVCCTETLAYGINSKVDVVIIPQMIKNRSDEGGASYLLPNEYMNYAGRAGRLREGSDPSEKRVGYVYPFINAPYVIDDTKYTSPRLVNNLKHWNDLCDSLKQPQLTYCRYFSLSKSEKPFYLLSLFPHSKITAAKPITSLEEIRCMLTCLPMPQGYMYSEQNDLRLPLETLVQLGMLRPYNSAESGKITDEICIEEDYYQLTDVGCSLTGYIISVESYTAVMNQIKSCYCSGNVLFTADILYTLLGIKEMKYMLCSDIRELLGREDSDIDVRNYCNIVLSYIYNMLTKENVIGTMTNKLQHELLLDKCEDAFILDMYLKIHPPSNDNTRPRTNKLLELRLRAFAASYFWLAPQFSTKDLHRRFYINTQMFHKITEKMSYLLDLFALAASNVELEISSMARSVATQKISQELTNISKAMYYQLPYEICQHFDVLLENVDTPHVADEVKKLRRVVNRLTRARTKIRSVKRMNFRERQSLCESINCCIDQLKTIELRHTKKIEEDFGEVFTWMKTQ